MVIGRGPFFLQDSLYRHPYDCAAWVNRWAMTCGSDTDTKRLRAYSPNMARDQNLFVPHLAINGNFIRPVVRLDQVACTSMPTASARSCDEISSPSCSRSHVNNAFCEEESASTCERKRVSNLFSQFLLGMRQRSSHFPFLIYSTLNCVLKLLNVASGDLLGRVGVHLNRGFRLVA
jgi:hypothetical protein